MRKFMKNFLFCIAVLTAAISPAGEKTSIKPEKTLIVYYSWGGNTKAVAQEIAKQTSGTLFELKPRKAYPVEYRKCTQVAKKDIADGVKAALVSMPDVKKYDVIFAGSPNWWGTMAPPVKTFLADAKLSGKTVIPFFTHGGGGMQRCETDVKKLLKKATVLPALTIPGSRAENSEKEISAWLERIVKKAEK